MYFLNAREAILFFYSKSISLSLLKKIFFGIGDRRSRSLRKKISGLHQYDFLFFLELIPVFIGTA